MTKKVQEINWHSGWRKQTSDEPVKPLKSVKFPNKNKKQKEREMGDN